MTLIAATDRAWAIGRAGALPWRLPGDLAHFRAATMGHTLVMGRKTFESLPGLLPGRAHIVLSRDAGFLPAGVEVLRGTAASLLAELPEDAFVIGGGEIFALLLPRCTRALVTRVDVRIAGADVFCPNLEAAPDWQCVRRGPWREEQGLRYRFVEAVACRACDV
ncbi:MAG: dihydrofolate reductase [Oscillospiraceae bacterium]|jgi:dihydrofolate reductase|nr:dihydrofolate reductase [Oscillospiraceae bacterium]